MQKFVCFVLAAMITMACGSANAIEPRASLFDESSNIAHFSLTDEIAALDETWQESGTQSVTSGKAKSTTKAFLLSLAVPGAGQMYYGSKTKALAFAGLEAASWMFHIKYHGDGENATDAYESYSAAHWSRSSYQDFLIEAYGAPDDDQLHEPEISHHLPETNTQQYYEMTGKYDQFGWGWDDSYVVFNSDTISLTEAITNNLDSTIRVTGDSTIPRSSNRQHYNSLRADANKKYDKATSILFVVMANHLASAFEALISTKKLNKKLAPVTDVLGNVKMKASLKSFYAKRDTPYVTLSYKFY